MTKVVMHCRVSESNRVRCVASDRVAEPKNYQNSNREGGSSAREGNKGTRVPMTHTSHYLYYCVAPSQIDYGLGL